MLEDTKVHTNIDDFQPVGGGQEDLAKLVEWTIGVLRRQYFVILFVAAIGVAACLIYLRITPPTFTAQASLYIDLHRNPLAHQEGIFGNDPIEIDSQIQIVKSEAIALAVINKLQLKNDRELNGDSEIAYLPKLWESKPPSESGLLQELIFAFEQRLVVSRIPGSRVLTVSYNSSNPDNAAQIANAVANAYLVDQLEAKLNASRVATNWLQERQQQLREQADAAQRAVDSFKKQNNIITTDGKSLEDQEVANLNSQLVATRAQASDLSARLSRLQAVIRLGPSDPNVDGAISEISSPIVMSLRQQYIDLARRESEWSARYGHNHLAVVNLRNRMQEIRQTMFDELRHFYETTRNDYEVALQRQQNIERQLANTFAKSQSTTQAQITLRGLESTASNYRILYDNFLQRYMGSAQTGSAQDASFPISEARVISPALPPLKKSKPKTLLILALGLFGSIGLGFGLAIVRDAMDRVFRTAKQLEAAVPVSCLATVPLLKRAPTEKSLHKAIKSNVGGLAEQVTEDHSVFRTVVDAPLSSFSEAIRSIKLAIDLQSSSKSCRVIGWTSAVPNEGKSTLAAALALLIHQVGARVLLVDCDLRNPSLTRMLAPEAPTGVVDVVSGKNSVAQAIWKDHNTNMLILPSGKKIPLFLTSELLSGQPMRKLFETLRESFDYIIVDLPPLAPIVDVRASTHLVDSLVLVVEWGRTKINLVEEALKSAPNIYDALIGTVLNKADMDFISRYDNTGRYDRNKHFSRYGYVD